MKPEIKKILNRYAIKTMVMFLLFSFAAADSNAFSLKHDRVRHRPGSGPTLDQWIETDLVPYLTNQLTRHPRFRGQPFLIVGLKGNRVQAEIDGVTSHIRDKVVDALLAEPGIRLAWRPAVDSFHHHRRPGHMARMPHDQRIQFYIGIDTVITPGDRQLYVKVRALDVEDNAWISGFGRSFSTKARDAEISAIQRKTQDEFLRGLRPLPFTSRQPDLLASYLALNMTGLFSQQEQDDLVVYVAPVKDDRFLGSVTRLLDTYLSQFSTVDVTGNPKKANTIIRTEIHAIDGNLYQIWVTARQKHNGVYLAGVETETYVLLDRTGDASAYGICRDHGPDASGHAGRFIISQDAEGRLTRLLPSTCGRFSDYPEDAKKIYAISVSDPLLAIWFDAKVRDLQVRCRKGDAHVRTPSRTDISDFRRYLAFLSEKTEGKLVFYTETIQ